MTGKTILAGLVGGLVLFLWGGLAHMALPLGELGISSVANEDPVLDAMRANIPQSGLYFLPGMAPDKRDENSMKVWEEKAKRGPVALIVYQTASAGAMSPAQLGTEFASNIGVGLLAAIVLAGIGGGLAARTGMAGLMGLMSSLDVYFSYWNWYKFPMDYTLAQIAIQVIGFVLMGAAIAAIVKKPSA